MSISTDGWRRPDGVPAEGPLGLNYEASNARLLFRLPRRRL